MGDIPGHDLLSFPIMNPGANPAPDRAEGVFHDLHEKIDIPVSDPQDHHEHLGNAKKTQGFQQLKVPGGHA